MASTKFHVYKGTDRTTVTLPKFLFDILAIKKGCKPETSEAYRTVRQQLQDFSEGYKSSNGNFSQWLQERMVLSLLETKLAIKYMLRNQDKRPRQGS